MDLCLRCEQGVGFLDGQRPRRQHHRLGYPSGRSLTVASRQASIIVNRNGAMQRVQGYWSRPDWFAEPVLNSLPIFPNKALPTAMLMARRAKTLQGEPVASARFSISLIPFSGMAYTAFAALIGGSQFWVTTSTPKVKGRSALVCSRPPPEAQRATVCVPCCPARVDMGSGDPHFTIQWDGFWMAIWQRTMFVSLDLRVLNQRR